MNVSVRKFYLSPYFRIGVGLVGGLLLLYLLVREVDFADIWQVLQKSRTQYVWLALGSVGLNVWAKTARVMIYATPLMPARSNVNSVGNLRKPLKPV